MSRHPEIDGGTRLGWRDGRRTLFIGLVGDARVHEAELRRIGGERVAFEPVPRTVNELEAIDDRILADEPALREAGFEVVAVWIEPQRGVVEVELVGGRDAAAAAQYFAERYGDAVAVEWLGPSRFREVPHPFGSWTSEGRLIRVFFGLDHNGQRRGSARVTEENGERIVIALTCLQPVGPITMIGGFQRQHADLELREPVGDRAVIDASASVARPLPGPAASPLSAGPRRNHRCRPCLDAIATRWAAAPSQPACPSRPSARLAAARFMARGRRRPSNACQTTSYRACASRNASRSSTPGSP